MSKATSDDGELRHKTRLPSQPPPHHQGLPEHGKTLNWSGIKIIHFDAENDATTKTTLTTNRDRPDDNSVGKSTETHTKKDRRRVTKRSRRETTSVSKQHDLEDGTDVT
jgi:hypothetical protein